MNVKQRTGVLVKKQPRLSEKQMQDIDEISHQLLEDPGLICYNQEAGEVYKRAGAQVQEKSDYLLIRIPEKIIHEALKSAPSQVVLGARNPDNRLILDAHEPRVRFGSGSETNVWLEVGFKDGRPQFARQSGSIQRLCAAAHLCDNLEHLDFFIRCVNIQDEGITADNKDVNIFGASFNNIEKHVQAGLNSLEALDELIKMGTIIAGGPDSFTREPPLSFIACIIKSPLQMVDSTTTKMMAIARRNLPVVISSSPMGGTTGPFDELSMVSQINAEILAGITLNQLVAPGAPVLYGSVPIRTRLDNLYDMYGAPEFNHYNQDSAQMANYYGIPCYSTAGVGDASEPGIQATMEKMLTLMAVPQSGAQYIHYAFGLLERTNVFCPEQAVLDNAHIGAVKEAMEDLEITAAKKEDTLQQIREVMATNHKTYMYHLPQPTREKVYMRYPLEKEEKEGGALRAAHEEYREIMEKERHSLPSEVQKDLQKNIKGILPQIWES